ncbi:MAG: aspartate/glutamate racemase family protein [Pseudomonadota bacterium]
MKILVVNGNTSQTVTDTVAKAAREAASPGTEILAVTARFGARIITSRSENAIAAHAVLERMAQHARDCDAALIAVSFDTALDAARQLLPIPVVGMTEASMLTACMLGGKFGMVVFGRRCAPMYAELIECHGLAARLAGLTAIEASATSVYSDPGSVMAEIAATADRLVDRDGAETVVLAGAAMAGMAPALQPKIRVPVLDGIACGIRQAEVLVRLRAPKPTAGSYAHPSPKELVGVDPALAAFFAERS